MNKEESTGILISKMNISQYRLSPPGNLHVSIYQLRYVIKY